MAAVPTAGLLCPVCEEPFRGPSHPSAPIQYPCGHTLCGLCTAAVMLSAPAQCSVCLSPIDGQTVNVALAEVAEAAFARSSSDAEDDLALPELKSRRLERACHQPLLDLASRCEEGSVAMAEAADTARHSKTLLRARASAAVQLYKQAIEEAKAALDVQFARFAQRVEAACVSQEKVLDSVSSECGVNACQLKACAGVCMLAACDPLDSDRVASAESCARSTLVVTTPAPSLRPLPAYVDVCVPAQGLGAIVTRAVDDHARVLDTLELDRCVAQGPGLHGFAMGIACEDNTFTVTVKDAHGGLLSSLACEDVRVCVVDSSRPTATCSGVCVDLRLVGIGTVRVRYTVQEPAPRCGYELHVWVAGHAVKGSPWRVHTGCAPNVSHHLGTLGLAPKEGNIGLAVCPDGTAFAVSNWATCTVEVYGLPDGRLVSKFGREGKDKGMFNTAGKLCFRGPKVLCVAESLNRRLQEVTVKGRHLRYLGVGVFEGGVEGVATAAEVIAASTSGAGSHHLYLFAAGSGALLRKLGPTGTGPSNLATSLGVRLSADAKRLVVADTSNKRVAIVNLEAEDGAPFALVGAGDLKEPTDVEFAHTGDVMVVDHTLHRVLVYTPTGVYLHGIGGLALLRSPIALGVCSGRLYVLEDRGAGVQVFGSTAVA